VIKINHLTYSYEDEISGEAKQAIKDLNLEIAGGSFVAIVGRNGSGKSTLAKNLNALLVPSEGDVFVDGINTRDADRVWDVRKTVGMVFQNPDNQLVSSVVEDDVAFGPENLGVDPKEIRVRVDEALKAVGMYEHRKKGPHLLSGGQKQRIAIAGVLAMRPECIVFDEPTAMLDPSGRREIMTIIDGLHKEGKTVILITHFMEEAAMADRVIVMHKGVVKMDAAPKDIFSHADELADLNLELPFAADIAEKLRKRGMKVPYDIVTEEALAEYLCGLK